jgi:hypothetical protein
MACKDKEKEAGAEKEVKPITFDVVLDAVVEKENMLILYYQDQPEQWFEADRAVWLGVKPNTASQTLTLSLPEGVLPRDIRLNYCFEKLRGPIQINSITLKYNGKSVFINKNEFLDYFKPNEYIKYDKETGLATPIEVDGKSNPFFTTQEKIWGVITNLNLGKI